MDKDTKVSIDEGNATAKCVPETPCGRNFTLKNSEVAISCSDNECAANITCKDGFVIEKVDMKVTTQHFVCDVMKKEWVDKDTKVSIRDANETGTCVPETCAGTPPQLKPDQVNVTSSCRMLEDLTRECTFKLECQPGMTITSSTTTTLTEKAVCVNGHWMVYRKNSTEADVKIDELPAINCTTNEHV
ncbi:hypothetical protein PMAYCL1PPCAC_17878, partial [Pristionchus mayeri]